LKKRQVDDESFDRRESERAQREERKKGAG
jgi:hypothetical protein